MTWTFRPSYTTMERVAEGFTHNQPCRDELVQGAEEKVCNSYVRKRRPCKRSKNSQVHLLPAFVLPPRDVENEEKAEGKRREINAHHHKHLEEMIEESGRPGPQVQRPKAPTAIKAPSAGQSERQASVLPHPFSASF